MSLLAVFSALEQKMLYSLGRTVAAVDAGRRCCLFDLIEVFVEPYVTRAKLKQQGHLGS